MLKSTKYNVKDTPSLTTNFAMETDQNRLSGVYSGLGPPEERKFFAHNGPSLFKNIRPSIREAEGHVNPAYQQDENDGDDDDFDSVDNPECRSSDTDMDSDSERNSIDRKQHIFDEETGLPEVKVTNGKVPASGKVGFAELAEQSHPPPPINRERKSKKVPKTWDRFTQSSNDNISGDDVQFWETVFVVTKIIICGLLFLLTLASAVVCKVCLVIITANVFPYVPSKNNTVLNNTLKTLHGHLIYPSDHTNVQWIWALILMAGAPYFFASIKSLWRLLFQMSGRASPQWSTIFCVLVIESIHSLGLNIMIFVVMPNLDPISGLLVSLCIGIIPGILKVFYPRTKEEGHRTKTMMMVVTFFSLIGALGQIAGIGMWFYHVYQHFNNKWTYKIMLIVAPLFTSIHWWENFVHEGKKGSSGLRLLARKMRKYRTKLMLYSSFWKLCLTLLLPLALYGISCKDGEMCIKTLYYKADSATLHSSIGHIELQSSKNFGECSNYLPLVTAAIGVLAGVVAFKLGKVACKIMAQVVGYSLPLVLSTPATFAVILAMYSGFLTEDSSGCYIPFPRWEDHHPNASTAALYFDSMADNEHWFMFGAALCGFFSLLLVTNHVWMPGKERLQRTDKLFVQPLYCGVFLDQSLLLNRRRIEKIKPSDFTKQRVRDMHLDDIEMENPEETKKLRTTETPMIYMCATMWHETENEMIQLLKSVFRMDEDQCTRRHAQFLMNRRDPDYYEFEGHIFFDDAYGGHEIEEFEYTVNEYVKLLVRMVELAGSAQHGTSYKISPPLVVPTPYGGRLIWTLPGKNKLIAHLKDKTFIRHRKRWSQVMYMYYFLGYEMFKQKEGEKIKRQQLFKRAENTFLLALDGDVDFHPKAVLLLVDRMRKNADVGAACGRIHPIGNGAMVWYQKFEYAVSHWLQKAAEDKFGCVLCSPGCFSLFRGSSLMDDNVMNRYTTPPSEARHYVQYDQGEDRWLCTLLLQQGHRVEYCAASDALTYAPEGFNEFFNQRRRWTPSTMANILDLLTDWRNVTTKNAEITMAYIMYQGLLMVSSILTPGTIFLMVLGAINLAYPDVDLWLALLLNTVPVAIMVILCFKAKPDTQLTYAAILSTLYSLVMMIVIVGLLRQAAEFGICSVTTAFLIFVAGVFVLAAFIHPQEFWCIIHGFLYFLAIPSMSMILMLYALGNLNNVSWGTRESKSAAGPGKGKEEKPPRFSGICSFLNGVCPTLPSWNSHSEDAKVKLILDRLNGIEENMREMSQFGSSRASLIAASLNGNRSSPMMMGESAEPPEPFQDVQGLMMGSGEKRKGILRAKENPMFQEEKQKVRDRMVDPYWIEEDQDIRLYKKADNLSQDENQFWWELIDAYLKPLEEDAKKKEEIKADLLELRNKVCLIFILINSLFIIVVFSLQQVVASENWSKASGSLKETGGSLSFPLPCADRKDDGTLLNASGQSVEPISVAFTLVFGVLLFVQFICMLMHRIATLLHICAATEIFKKKRKIVLDKDEQTESSNVGNVMSYDQVYEMVKDMQKDQEADSISLTSESSYAGSDVDDDEEAAKRKRESRERWKNVVKQRKRNHGNTLGANFRKNFVKFQSFVKEEDLSTAIGNLAMKDDDVMKNMKKKTHFNRMNMKSMKVLTNMAKKPWDKTNAGEKEGCGDRKI
ncbi:CHS2-like protein [Mya arenaria]|uniref:chitin synthase n=1 Tax=Mya arenaria TaxID=6604 RepID=A0ABY7EKT6_MYAAR|nr:CHS2-like protein [Mya arenaria]